MPLNTDTPISDDVEEQTQLDTDQPIEDGLPTFQISSPIMRNTEILQAATIETELNDEKPLFKAFQEISQSEPDTRSALKSRASRKAQQDKEELFGFFKEAPGITQEQVEGNLEAVQSISDDLDKEGMDENLQFVRSSSQGLLDPETEKQIAVNLTVSKMIKDISDNMGWFEVIDNGIELLIPGGIFKDNYDLSGNPFNTKEWMRNFVLNFKQLSPEQQLDILPTVRQFFWDKLDNKFTVMSALDKLIQPGSEEDMSEFSAIWATLDLLDIGVIGASVILNISRSVKTLNAVKTMEMSNNIEKAGEINAASVMDAEIAVTANVDRNTTAVNNATGFEISGLDEAAAPDISQETMQRINLFTDQVQQTTKGIEGSDLFLREGLLQKAERNSIESAKIEELTGIPNIENVSVAERGDGVTTFTFDVRKADGSFDRKKYNMQLSLDDVGQYEQSSIGVVSRFAVSPTVWAKKNLIDDVHAAIRADSANAKIMNQLIALQREATKSILGPAGLKGITPVGRKKLAQLDQVLMVGDESKRVYTPLELKAGVDGIKLDEKQIEAYYKVRSVVDSLFQLRNSTKRQELHIKGMRHITLSEEAFQIGKPFHELDTAQGSLAAGKPKIVWRKDSNQFIRTTELELDTDYAHGYRLVRFNEPVTPPGEFDKVNYALVHIDDITDLPNTVLHYRDGYVPKINQNVNYFVKEFTPSRIDGENIAATDGRADVTTLRFFDNRRDAETFMEAEAARDPNRVLRVLEDRQLEQERRSGAVDGPGVGGYGMYTGPRASEDIPFGLDGLKPDRLGSFEAISRNLASVSRYVPRNAWRLGMEQRAINTANSLLPGTRFSHFNQLVNVPDTEAGRFIRKLHDQIEEWMGFPTKEELLWSAMVQETYESVGMAKWMPNFGKKSIQYLKHKDPIASARAAAFHSLLGWFNPIQIFVQAQGAAVAMSTNLFRPLELANSLRLQTALAAVDHIDSTAGIAHAAKAFGMKTEDLVEMKKLWTQTGLRDSILTTADHAAAARGHGVAMDSLSRLANKGLFNYRIGELFNRRTSFTTALLRWKANNPGKVVKSEDLKDILTRTNDMMLNLTKANRASWQKGALSIPTQFLQVSTKTMETLLGGNTAFTRVERGQIFTGQLLLYGAAGIPLGSMGANWLVQQMGYTSQSDIETKLDPLTRKAINEGFEGWATMAMFGIDIDIGARASLASGVNQFLDRLLFEDSTLAEQFLGAFGSANSRFWQGFDGVYEPLSMGMAGVREFDPLQAFSDIAETLSSWNNVSKALFMHRFDIIKDRHGRPIRKRDFTTSEEIARALGFRLSEEVQVYDLKDMLKAKKDLRSDVIDSIVKVMWDYSIKAHGEELTDDYKDSARRKMALLMQTLDTSAERKIVRDAVKERMSNGTDEFSRAWRKVRTEWNDGQVNLIERWRDNLTSNGILQQRSVAQENK